LGKVHYTSLTLIIFLLHLSIFSGQVACTLKIVSTTLVTQGLSVSQMLLVPSVNRTYGGVGEDSTYSMVQTMDNGFALAGYTDSSGAGKRDFWLIKTDELGNVQWNKTYGGSHDDIAHSVIQLANDGFVLAGSTMSFGGGDFDFWLVCTDSVGNMVWNRTYGGIGYDEAWSVIQTTDGGFALAGWTTSFGLGSGDIWLIKTDNLGNPEWNKTYGEIYFETANSIKQTIDEGFALIGSTYSYGAGGSDLWLVKTDSSGNELWNKTYGGGGEDFGYSMIQTVDGGFALAGSTSSLGAGIYDFWLIKTDGAGNEQWNMTYGGIGYDEAWSVIPTFDGGLALAGWTESIGADCSECWLIKTDFSGNEQWNITWGGTNYDYAYSAMQTNEGGYAIVGETTSLGAGYYDSLLVIWPELSDIEIRTISTSKTVVGQGYGLTISIGVVNCGINTEIFNVTTYANTIVIATLTNITLTSQNLTTVTLTWGTVGFAKGNYTTSAYAWPVPSENDTADNALTDGWVVIAMVGDISSDTPGVPDGKVDMVDMYEVAKRFGINYPDPRFVPNYDVDGDLKIDMVDMWIAAKEFGKIEP